MWARVLTSYSASPDLTVYFVMNLLSVSSPGTGAGLMRAGSSAAAAGSTAGAGSAAGAGVSAYDTAVMAAVSEITAASKVIIFFMLLSPLCMYNIVMGYYIIIRAIFQDERMK